MSSSMKTITELSVEIFRNMIKYIIQIHVDDRNEYLSGERIQNYRKLRINKRK